MFLLPKKGLKATCGSRRTLKAPSGILNENAEVHFLVRDGRATWAIVYAGGLMADASRRVR
jgi:hypothetical protein